MTNRLNKASAQRPKRMMCRRAITNVLRCAMITAGLFVVGCADDADDTSGVQVNLTLDPSPPVVGEAVVSLVLKNQDGTLLEKAEVKIEGNMNHAGMKPSFADLTEVEPGKYDGTLDFTMGGDWFILVTAQTPNGQTIERKIDVEGVQAR